MRGIASLLRRRNRWFSLSCLVSQAFKCLILLLQLHVQRHEVLPICSSVLSLFCLRLTRRQERKHCPSAEPSSAPEVHCVLLCSPSVETSSLGLLSVRSPASYAREYVAKVGAELQKICDDILALMDKNLIPSARRITETEGHRQRTPKRSSGWSRSPRSDRQHRKPRTTRILRNRVICPRTHSTT